MSTHCGQQLQDLIAHGTESLRRWEGERALECFQHAISLLPPFLDSCMSLKEYRQFQLGLIPAYCGAARAFQQVGKPAEAINYLLHAFKIAPQAPHVQQTFAAVVCCMEVEEYQESLAHAAIDLLYSPQVNPQDLALLGWSLWKTSPNAATALPLRTSTLPEDLLFKALLTHTVIPKQEFELLFMTLRKECLHAALKQEPLHQWTSFLEALALYARLTEYISAVSPQEQQELNQLKHSLNSQSKEYPALVALIAAYAPLGREYDNGAVKNGLPKLYQKLFEESEQEAGIQQRIARFGAIDDRVSKLVEHQYEQNPYPQWLQVAPVAKKSFRVFLSELFPHRDWSHLKEKPSILIAGCGTGSHVAKTAYQIEHADILALDLSRTSLAYAQRKTQALPIHGIEYMQMDLLDLPAYGKTYDLIEAVGVLHHMEKPLDGLRALKKCLNPHGIMNLGLYSTLARQDVWAARDLLQWQGEPVTLELIRAARQQLWALPENHLARSVTESLDFFSVSGVRDLLYNVQEHTFTIPQIVQLLKEVGLEWIGFEWWHPQWPRRYRKAFPEDPQMRSLDLWELFEKDNPQTFLGMYNFWVKGR